jgi:hypothetical protein
MCGRQSTKETTMAHCDHRPLFGQEANDEAAARKAAITRMLAVLEQAQAWVTETREGRASNRGQIIAAVIAQAKAAGIK